MLLERTQVAEAPEEVRPARRLLRRRQVGLALPDLLSEAIHALLSMQKKRIIHTLNRRGNPVGSRCQHDTLCRSLQTPCANFEFVQLNKGLAY